MVRKLNETVQLKLRFSETLRRRLEKEAVRKKRSLNTEIIERLEQSFQKDDMRGYVEATALATANAVAVRWPPGGLEAQTVLAKQQACTGPEQPQDSPKPDPAR